MSIPVTLRGYFPKYLTFPGMSTSPPPISTTSRFHSGHEDLNPQSPDRIVLVGDGFGSLFCLPSSLPILDEGETTGSYRGPTHFVTPEGGHDTQGPRKREDPERTSDECVHIEVHPYGSRTSTVKIRTPRTQTQRGFLL